MAVRLIEALVDAAALGAFCLALYIGAALISGAA
ncbi:hypothetical protein ABIB96_001236 [Bradyrhizobium sp. LA3.X]